MCLVSVRGTPEAEPIMVPLPAIRVPPRVHCAKRRRETGMQIQVKKPRIEQSSDDDEYNQIFRSLSPLAAENRGNKRDEN
ncbi:hypothetical protein ABZP36_021796 [Zizania latifolia]